MKGYTYGIEHEVILLDMTGNCAPFNAQIIQIFQERYPNFINNIKPELDACQVELITDVHNSLQLATIQIIRLTGLVKKITRELQYTLSKNPAPSYLFDQRTTSTVKDPIIQQKYRRIDIDLREKSIRDATNIAGIHINIGHSNQETILALHRAFSSKVQGFIDTKNLEALSFNTDRFIKYKQVVDALGTTMIFESEDGIYCDDEGNPKDQGHSLVRLKKYNDQYVTEVRTPHGGYDQKSIQQGIKTIEKNLIIPAMSSISI